MVLNKIIIGLILFVLVITVGTTMVSDLNNNYKDYGVNITSNSEFGEFYNISDEIYNTTAEIKNDMVSNSPEEDDNEGSIIAGAYKATKKSNSLFNLIGNLIMSVSKSLGIPTFIINLGLALLAIVIAYAIILLIFRIKG